MKKPKEPEPEVPETKVTKQLKAKALKEAAKEIESTPDEPKKTVKPKKANI